MKFEYLVGNSSRDTSVSLLNERYLIIKEYESSGNKGSVKESFKVYDLESLNKCNKMDDNNESNDL